MVVRLAGPSRESARGTRPCAQLRVEVVKQVYRRRRWALRTRREDRPVRILMLLENHTFPSDVRVRQEAATLRNAGFRVTVICPVGNGQRWREDVQGVRVYRYPVPFQLPGALGYVWEYGAAMLMVAVLTGLVLVTDGFDVLHAHNPPDLFFVLGVAYKLLGKAFVFDHHDLSPELFCVRLSRTPSSWVYRVLLKLERLTCRWADVVISTNLSYKQTVVERADIPEDRVFVVRNGPMMREWPHAPGDSPHCPSLPYRVCYLGTINVQDGVDGLVRAIAHLAGAQHSLPIEWTVVGDGDALPEVRALAEELGVAEAMVFTGWVDDQERVREYLRVADVCVDPAPSNALNDRSTMIKILEYMAAGKPIVAFDLPETRFSAQEAALYATPNDEKDLAAKILMLLSDQNMRTQRGAAGRRRIEDHLAWEYSAEALLLAYSTMLGQNVSESKRSGAA